MKYRIRIALAFIFVALMAFQSGRLYAYLQTREVLEIGHRVNDASVVLAELELPL